MFEFIQVTAEYSNAVFVAIFPLFADFTEKVDLPIPVPITLQQTEHFVCNIQKGNPGGYLALTNGLELWYNHGHISGFRTPRSYFNLQNPADVPKFFGPLKLNRDEALQLARNSLVKLGYTLKETFADQEPETTMPRQIGTNVVPHYRFRWIDPVDEMTAVAVEVDGYRGRVQEMILDSPFLWRTSPIIAVQPKVVSPVHQVSMVESNAFLIKMLPKLSAYARQMELPFHLPITLTEVERVEFVDVESDVRIKLSNGYWMTCEKDKVSGFNAPDSVYGRQPTERRTRIENYLGTKKMTDNEIINLARETIRKAGYQEEDFNAQSKPEIFDSPKPVGSYVVPRYSIRWTIPYSKDSMGVLAEASVEVDAASKSVKFLHLFYGGRELPPSPNSKTNTLQTTSPATKQ